MANVVGASQVQGKSDKGDFVEALKKAVASITSSGDMQHVWRLSNVSGLVGGIAPINELTVTLEVHGLYLQK